MKRISFYPLFIVLIFCIGVFNINAQSKKETDLLIREKVLTKTNVKQLRSLKTTFHQQFTEEKSKAFELAEENGWPTQMEKDGRFIELMKVDKDGNPIYYTTYNANAAISTRATTLHNGGLLGLNLEGQGMTAHVWDGGLALSTHQEYDGIGGTDRFSIGDNSTALNYHSAHVTGTIIASGVQADAKGMAPQAHAVGYDWNADISEVAEATASGMLLSNHSYGWVASDLPDWVFGAYVADSRDWDEVLYNAPYYLMCVAAGNDGNDNASNGAPLGSDPNYDKLTGHALAKNNLVVANGREIAIDANGDFVSMSINGSSSEGPTDDYRIKPDITGNGTNIYSTYETSNSAYESLTGTSMASPNVCGTLLLLQQYYSEQYAEFMKAATLKGLALHTADDAGPAGPDAAFGWGLMNAKKAAQVIENNFDGTIISELALNDGETYIIDVFASGAEDLTASVSWTDVPGIPNEGTANDNTPVLVNDLDIRITESTNTFYPFRLTSVSTSDNGDNTVDPYEKIIVGSPAAGTRYTITVAHKGTLAAKQDFSLIITGIENSSPNNFAAVSNHPNQIDLSWNKNSSEDDVIVAWSADGTFGNPVDQTNYNIGDVITDGGSVLYKGSQASFNHSSLQENTTYYYKIWSVLPSGDYSAGVYAHTTTIKSTPTDYPTSFAAGAPTGTTIPLTWTDAAGSVVPDGYLIKGSYVGFEDIAAPVDGTVENDSRLVKNIISGVESKVLDSLMGETNYYFKIYPYTNSGSNIKYKTDATPPEASATTDVDPCADLTLPYAEDFDSGDNCWNGVTGNGSWINTTPTTPAGDHTGGGACFVTNGNSEYATNAIYDLISPNVSLYGFNNCELTFWIYMNAELSSNGDYWDGGFIECWDGNQWTKVTTSLPYDGTLHAGNPLGEQEGWAPESIRDWTQVTVDLSAYDENPDFQFRIRFASDGGSGGAGWAIDDVNVTGDATCMAPEDQATDFIVQNSTYYSLEIGWTRGIPNGGDNVLVVANEAGVSHVDPIKGNSYTANTAFGSGSEIGAGNFVVYNGTGTSVNVTNLSNLTSYDFSIYEYSLSDFCYNLIELSGDAITDAKPVASNHVASFSAGAPTPNEIPLMWTDAAGAVEPDGYLILANTTGTFTDPTNAIPVEDDTNLGDGAGAINIEQGEQGYTFANLDFDTQYYFKIFPYTNTDNFIIYKTEGTVPTDNATTLIDPCSIDITSFPYQVDFGSTEAPQCWDVLDNEGNGQVWQFGTIDDVAFGTGNYAFLDSDGYDLGNDQNSDLVTHTFNFSSYEDVTLSFDHYYKHIGESSATLFYSIDNGASWTQIQQWTTSTNNPEAFSQVLNELSGQSQVKFKFNYIGGFSWYWCIDDLQVDATMLCTPPSDQAVDFNSPAQTTGSIDIEWTRGTPGGGDEVIVLAKKAGAVDANPASGVVYNADAAFGSGSEIGAGNYVVYAGAGNSVTVNNLNGNTNYHFAIYEYDAATPCYLAPGLTGNASTSAKDEPTNHATSLAVGTTTATEMQINWIDATGTILPDGYLLVANTTGAFTDPTDTNSVTDDADLSDGSAVMNVAQGIESYTFTGLEYSTQYFFKLYPYSNSGTLINFKTDGAVPETNGTTSADPCVVDLSATDYIEDFESVITPALPSCTSMENANNDGYKWGSSSDYPNSGLNHLSIQYNGSAVMNDWFFSQPLQLKAGHEYELSFWYRARSASYPEKLKVKLGTANSSSSMTLDQLFDNNNIVNETYTEGQQTFSVAADGVYYLGWQGYSDVNMWFLYVDDISVTDLGSATNSAPVVANPISDMTETEGFVSTTIDITSVFTDADGDELTYSTSSDATNVATVSLSGTTLTITEAGTGTANIMVTANDGNGGSANDVFEFNVNATANNAPVVANPISDMTETEGFVSTTIDISSVFTDADGDELTFSASSDATNVATVSLSGTTLTITEAGTGTANITVSANDGNGGSANDVFEFNVNATANNAPVVANPISDITETEGFVSTTIDISSVFTDADGDELTFSASSDATNVATASLSGTTLTITETGTGTANITVTANDGNGGSANDVFEFNVNATANNAPVVENPISDMTETEGFVSTTIDITSVFTDADGDELTYSTSSDATNVATVSLSGTTLTITEAGTGTANITVTANDGNGGSANDVFEFNVNATANNAPVVANPISDMTETEGFVSTTIDITSVFTDADGDELTFSTSSDATNVATVSLSGTTLTITEAGTGTANITVTANDGNGGSANDVFEFNVNATANNAPVVANPISDMTETEGFVSTTIDITSVFTDADGDELTYSTSSDATNVATVSLSGTTLTITEAGTGTANITVTANDGNGGSANDVFEFNVNATANNAPVVANPISDMTETEGFVSTTIDISSVFTDADGDELTYSTSSDATNVATVSLSGTTLTITEAGTGTANITVTANDGNGGSANDVFEFNVNATANNAPVVANPISDMTETEGFVSTTIDITSVFTDADGDELTYSTSSDATNVATVSLSGTTLTITEAGTGTANITVSANDGNGGSANDVFEFNVNATANNAPVVANPISDMTETEGFVSTTIDITSVFTDADGDELTYSTSSDATNVATVSLSGTTLTITEAGTGTANITVSANDGNGGSANDVFEFNVNATANNAPVVANPISDMTETEGFVSTTIDITSVFTDADGDELTYSTSSDATNVATVSLSGTTLTITEAGTGTANITVSANDGNGGSANDVFEFNVNAAANNAPVVANPISDMTETEGFVSTTIDITSVFTDADGDELTYSTSSDATNVATVSLSGTTLTITEAGTGTANITVTANDGNGGSVSDVFEFNVNATANNAPVVENPISDMTETEGFVSTTIDITSVFTDADDDELTFSTSSDATNVATVILSGTTLTITEAGTGTANITVTANDGNGGSASDVFEFVVEDDNSVADIEVNNILVYPNPAKDYINIKFEQGNRKLVKYELFATTGECVAQGVIGNYEDEFQIDVAGYQSGLYFIKLSNETNQCAFKISIK